MPSADASLDGPDDDRVSLDAVDAAAARVDTLLDSRPPTLGLGRCLALDGPAGSGKTTMADAVARRRGGRTRIVHMDDLYEGWEGLATVASRLDGLLRPLAEDMPGHYRRWDWYAGQWAETVTVAPLGPDELLVVEGVGSGSRECADLLTVLVWLEADHDVRKRRGLDRDGAAFAPHWEAWASAERQYLAAHDTRARADLVVAT